MLRNLCVELFVNGSNGYAFGTGRVLKENRSLCILVLNFECSDFTGLCDLNQRAPKSTSQNVRILV